MTLTLQVNGEDVWHSADDVRAVSLRSTARGEAGAMRLDPDSDETVNIVVQTLDANDNDPAAEDETGPTANAGPDLTCVNNETVTLVGTGSNGDTLTYLWEQVSGPTTPTLNNSTTNTANFTSHATTDGTYVFKLTVTDADGREAHDFAVVVVA